MAKSSPQPGAELDIAPGFDAFEARYERGEPQVLSVKLIADLETPVSAYLKLTRGRGAQHHPGGRHDHVLDQAGGEIDRHRAEGTLRHARPVDLADLTDQVGVGQPDAVLRLFAEAGQFPVEDQAQHRVGGDEAQGPGHEGQRYLHAVKELFDLQAHESKAE